MEKQQNEIFFETKDLTKKFGDVTAVNHVYQCIKTAVFRRAAESSEGFIRCRRRERKGRGAPAGPGKAFSARPRPWLCAVFGTLRLVKKYRVYCTWDTVGKKAKKGEEHHAIEQRIRTERR